LLNNSINYKYVEYAPNPGRNSKHDINCKLSTLKISLVDRTAVLG